MSGAEAMLKILDTFSGIGGFSLAAAWTGGIETVAFCEIEPFCRQVLNKHWPEVPIHTDIKELNGRDLVQQHGAIDIICGGPPCQPASCAGLRRGTDDDRWLWPEAIRLVREIHPRWCVFENPTGILTLDGGLAFEHLLLEMENEGYAVQPVIIPAGGAGAPHLRYRIWIIANAGGERCNRQPVRLQPGQSRQEGFEAARSGKGLADANHGERGGKSSEPVCIGGKSSGELGGRGDDVSYAGCPRLEERQGQERQRPYSAITGSAWWATEPAVGRVANGIPHRVDRIRGLGNAIVPQAVYPIFQAIVEIERKERSVAP